MSHHEVGQSDYGTGQKKLGMYLAGVISCIILTVVAFWAVMSGRFSKGEVLTIIFSAACIQFLVQVICFLRLTTETEQGKTNVMTFVFTGVILLCFVVGSLWIMNNLNYYALI
ncbi:MAG: cytochrome o ubiquinol oxidase subunit IV [Gammaproteobacteria bacterium]|nr:cytochrome o ubiquinol oxidase subunit IV [Gammaproteobacteria bacterium]